MWRTDGTPEGTYPLGEFPGSTGLPRFAQFVHDLVLFRGDDGIHGEELWVTDGTAAGTSLLKDIAPVTLPVTAGRVRTRPVKSLLGA